LPVLFHEEQVRSGLKQKRKVKSWIIATIKTENLVPGDINVVFLEDEDLLKINIEYLSRNYYTDIITFDYSEENVLNGDMLISVDRIADNAKKYNASKEREMLRVIIHGILHLAGYKDSSRKEISEMRHMEEKYLDQYYSEE
jgi:rRNA maturation RNase YbeY